MLRLRPFDPDMLRLRPFSFVDCACHPETAGSRRKGTSIESIMAVTYLSHDQSRLVTYVTDCYAKVGPTFFLVQLSWTNFFCWSNKKLDKQLAALVSGSDITFSVSIWRTGPWFLVEVAWNHNVRVARVDLGMLGLIYCGVRARTVAPGVSGRDIALPASIWRTET